MALLAYIIRLHAVLTSDHPGPHQYGLPNLLVHWFFLWTTVKLVLISAAQWSTQWLCKCGTHNKQCEAQKGMVCWFWRIGASRTWMVARHGLMLKYLIWIHWFEIWMQVYSLAEASQLWKYKHRLVYYVVFMTSMTQTLNIELASAIVQLQLDICMQNQFRKAQHKSAVQHATRLPIGSNVIHEWTATTSTLMTCLLLGSFNYQRGPLSLASVEIKPFGPVIESVWQVFK